MNLHRSVETNWKRSFLVLAAAVLLALAGFWLLDAVMYPWAVSVTSPTLPGTWQGELTTPTGREQWFALELSADDAGRHGNLKVLGASARLCGADGLREYDGFTRPENWRGTQFNMVLAATDRRPEGLAFINLSADWDRTNQIRAQAQFASGGSQTVATERGSAPTRPGADPDTLASVYVTLRRGLLRDFEAACARLNPLTARESPWRKS
jgi:hypothetical protein